ncbi:MAG: MFS transporter [Chloroflexi bacterium]|nr:MFS transporter [Chloroflexota bacterium]
MTGNRKPFYGWWVVTGAALVMSASLGVGNYAFGVFARPLAEEFDQSRASVFGVITTQILVSGLCSPLIGRLCDKYGPRRVMMWSAVPFGASVLSLSFTNSVWQLYLIYGVQAFFFAGLFAVPTGGLVNAWFIRHRGMAMGVALAGVSLGGLVIAPLAAYLISFHGWRTAFVALAIISWVVILPLVFLVLKDSPRQMGLLPDGDPAPAEGTTHEGGNQTGTRVIGITAPPLFPAKQWRPGTAFRSPAFWCILIGFSLVNLAQIGVQMHQVPYLIDSGIPALLAGTIFGITIGLGVPGKIAIGALADRLSRVHLAMVTFAFQAVSVAVLMWASGLAMAWTFAVIYGFSSAGAPTLRPLIVGEFFGEESFGAIYGVVELARLVGAAMGPIIAAILFDMTGHYRWAFIIYIIAYAAGVAAVGLARPAMNLGKKRRAIDR